MAMDYALEESRIAEIKKWEQKMIFKYGEFWFKLVKYEDLLKNFLNECQNCINNATNNYQFNYRDCVLGNQQELEKINKEIQIDLVKKKRIFKYNKKTMSPDEFDKWVLDKIIEEDNFEWITLTLLGRK